MDRIKQKLDMSEKEFEKVCILHCLISAREFDCWASTRGVVVITLVLETRVQSLVGPLLKVLK
jgi:hypothetical protein